MTKKRWQIENIEIDPAVLKAAGDPLLAKLLKLRGVDSVKKVQEFLDPEKMEIISPYAFCDMEKAVERIFSAIEKQEHIVVWGDFDADGVSSTSIMYKTFEELGANFSYYIPKRDSENHGLNSKALLTLVSKKKAKLVITVDCGVTNVKEVALLNSFKVDTIITDHHEAGEGVADAYAVINPKAPNSIKEEVEIENIEKLTDLAGCGVAYKLCEALLDKAKKSNFKDNLVTLVAIGTVGDVVPLFGENRYFVQKGLKLIQNGINKGISALLASCNYKGEVTSEQIAFGIAPRINASGRLDTVENALNVLIGEDENKIKESVEILNELNKTRQEICDQMFNEALELIDEKDPAIVLYKEDWHIGVIGIVASKLVEKYNKPAFLMCNGAENIIRCSSRSIAQVNIYEVLTANSDMFEGFGGHAFAGGLAFDKTKHPFLEVKEALNKTVADMCAGVDITPVVELDLEIGADELDFDLIDKISILEPFGQGNRAPAFCIKNCELKLFKAMGQNFNHLKFFVSSNNKDLECVWWNHSELLYKINSKIDIAFCPKINAFNSKTSIQLDIKDIQGETEENEKNTEEIKIFDHRRRHDIFKNITDYILKSPLAIGVYAQDQKIKEILCEYPVIFDKIFDDSCVLKADAILFFDYPDNEEKLIYILERAKPLNIHLMEYMNEHDNLDLLLSHVFGMLKYAFNKLEGKTDYKKMALALGKDEEFFCLMLDVFKEIGAVEFKNETEILCLNNVNDKSLQNSLAYKKLKKNVEYKKKLTGMGLEEFKEYTKKSCQTNWA